MRVLLLLLLQAGVVAQERPLWGGLVEGPYEVGFESRWEKDFSRTYSCAFDGGGHYDGPRPILINLWYPAESALDAECMVHGDYLDVTPEDPELHGFARALSDYARGVITHELLYEERPSATDREAVEDLFATATASYRNAAPLPGPFPLVLYHSGYGSSYEDNAVLCELLASHGFVVLGSAFPQGDGSSFNIDGKDGSFRDLDYLIRAASELPRVDATRLGMVGHSGGAHVSLHYRSRPDSAVDAVVSLDTTQDYWAASNPLWSHAKAVLDNLEHMTAPLLLASGSHGWFDLGDRCKKAQRYYLTFRDLDHNDYILQGIAFAEIAVQRGEGSPEQARALRSGYEALCNTVLVFLQTYLKSDAEAAQVLSSRYRSAEHDRAAVHLESVPPGTTAPEPYDLLSEQPPTPRQLRPLLRRVGAPRVREILEELQRDNPDSPLLHSVFAMSLLHDLVEAKEEDAARVMADFYGGRYPALADLLLWYANRAWPDRPYCDSMLRAALLLDPDNPGIHERLEQLKRGSHE